MESFKNIEHTEVNDQKYGNGHEWRDGKDLFISLISSRLGTKFYMYCSDVDKLKELKEEMIKRQPAITYINRRRNVVRSRRVIRLSPAEIKDLVDYFNSFVHEN